MSMTPLRWDAATFPPAYDYLSELSEEEKGLGFEEELIPAPDDAAVSRTLPAVVFRIDESNRIVKIRDELLDRPVYLHQCYGTCRRFKTPAWRPVQYSYSTPQLAIRSWERGLDNSDGRNAVYPYIEACAPEGEFGKRSATRPYGLRYLK